MAGKGKGKIRDVDMSLENSIEHKGSACKRGKGFTNTQRQEKRQKASRECTSDGPERDNPLDNGWHAESSSDAHANAPTEKAAIWRAEAEKRSWLLRIVRKTTDCASMLIFGTERKRQTTSFGSSYANSIADLRAAEKEVEATRKMVVVAGPSGCGKSTLLRLAGSCEEATADEPGQEGLDDPKLSITSRIDDSCDDCPQIETFYEHSTVEITNEADGTRELALVRKVIDAATGKYVIRYDGDERQNFPQGDIHVHLYVDPVDPEDRPPCEDGFGQPLLARAAFRVATEAQEKEFLKDKKRKTRLFGNSVHAKGENGDSTVVKVKKTYAAAETKVLLRGLSQREVAYYIHKLFEELHLCQGNGSDAQSFKFSKAARKARNGDRIMGRRLIGVPDDACIESIAPERICCFQEHLKAIGQVHEASFRHEGLSAIQVSFLFGKLCEWFKNLTTGRVEENTIVNDLSRPFWKEATAMQPDHALQEVVEVDCEGRNFITGSLHEAAPTPDLLVLPITTRDGLNFKDEFQQAAELLFRPELASNGRSSDRLPAEAKVAVVIQADRDLEKRNSDDVPASVIAQWYAANADPARRSKLKDDYDTYKEELDGIRRRHLTALEKSCVQWLESKFKLPGSVARELAQRRIKEAVELRILHLSFAREAGLDYDGYSNPGDSRGAPEDTGLDWFVNLLKEPPLKIRQLDPIRARVTSLVASLQLVGKSQLQVFRLQYGGRPPADVFETLNLPVQQAMAVFGCDMAKVRSLPKQAAMELREIQEPRASACTPEIAAKQIVARLCPEYETDESPEGKFLRELVGKTPLSKFPLDFLKDFSEELNALLDRGEWKTGNKADDAHSVLDVCLHPILGVGERTGQNDIVLPACLVTTNLGMVERDLPDGAGNFDNPLYEMQLASRRVKLNIKQALVEAAQGQPEEIVQLAVQLLEAEMLALDVDVSAALQSKVIPDLDGTHYFVSLFGPRSAAVASFSDVFFKPGSAIQNRKLPLVDRLRAFDESIPTLVAAFGDASVKQLHKDCTVWQKLATTTVRSATKAACEKLRNLRGTRQTPTNDDDCAREFPRVLRVMNVLSTLAACHSTLESGYTDNPDGNRGSDAPNPDEIDRWIKSDNCLLQACVLQVPAQQASFPLFSEVLEAARTGNPAAWVEALHPNQPVLSKADYVARLEMYAETYEDYQMEKALKVLDRVVNNGYCRDWVTKNQPKEPATLIHATDPGDASSKATADQRDKDISYLGRILVLACWNHLAEGMEKEGAEEQSNRIYYLFKQQLPKVAAKRGWSEADLSWITQADTELWLAEYENAHRSPDAAWENLSNPVPDGVDFGVPEGRDGATTSCAGPDTTGADTCQCDPKTGAFLRVGGIFKTDSNTRRWLPSAASDFLDYIVKKHFATHSKDPVHGRYAIQLPWQNTPHDSLKGALLAVAKREGLEHENGAQCAVCNNFYQPEHLYKHPHVKVPICAGCLRKLREVPSNLNIAPGTDKFDSRKTKLDPLEDFCSWCGKAHDETRSADVCWGCDNKKCGKVFCKDCLIKRFGRYIKTKLEHWKCPACCPDDGPTQIRYWKDRSSSLQPAPPPGQEGGAAEPNVHLWG